MGGHLQIAKVINFNFKIIVVHIYMCTFVHVPLLLLPGPWDHWTSTLDLSAAGLATSSTVPPPTSALQDPDQAVLPPGPPLMELSSIGGLQG